MNRIQFRSAIGNLELNWADSGKLLAIQLGAKAAASRPMSMPTAIADLFERLRKYLEQGDPLGDVDWAQLDDLGWTEFQKQVYSAITRIPHGETRTYGWVALRMGNIGATRAVGQALKKNPFPILIPCHRVVSAHSLGGFMGKAGAEDPEILIKKKLLALEDNYRNPPFSFEQRLDSVS